MRKVDSMKKQKYLNYLGWSGGAVSLLAYGLNTQQIFSSGSLIFLAMNVFGCSCLIFYTFRKGAFANTVINSIYLLVTLFAITRQFI
jgi:hypothetical protein